ncbi:TPM domain-containing protein [Lacticaseibacillus paracasei]|uniref:Beta-propeller domains of methanol dehydrogenase type n=1 Tax=Lacticaseibacillus paracasei (strain ATCC 334 / BCRC 17002 / CCUG 31169 / CIP 107868 / KCTC 3260 / NRRL B-441) TaxID=321967 RepID=Q03CM1_LACP3|nr:TPM domain-containing protein [Lacticaseibacillus paracasei]ABJ69051.1 Beta-propeller domains of methanol dehydrogenase type [Lacticaseibacillus paracasei ATCC 334]
MHKYLWWLIPLVLLLGIGAATQQSVQAASGTWYRDDGDMMGAKSQAAVNRLNNETFAKVKGHPQLAVITVKSLDDDEIEDYANDQFAKLGIGKKGWDNGLLLVLSREDRKYWLEVGYGLEDVVPDGSADEIVTSKVKTQLKAQNYDEAIALFLDHIGQRVTANQSAIATPAQITAKRARDAAIQQAILIAALILMALLVLFFVVHMAMAARLRDAMRDTVALEAMPLYAAVMAAGIPVRRQTASLPLFKFAWSHAKLREIGLANLARRGFESWTRVLRLTAPYPYWYYYQTSKPLRQLADQDVVAAPSVSALAALLTPALADRFAKGRPYEASYAQWLGQQKNVAGQAAVTTWSKFLENVKETDRFSAEMLAATFGVILFHIRHPEKNQDLSQYDLPLWVVSDFGSSAGSGSSGGSDNFGSGFGGGSSGGGGFGGSW